MAGSTAGTHHPFTGYNKKETPGVVVGNWVEERALLAATGVFRYKEWVKDSKEGSVYAVPVGAPEDNPTYPRVLEHSDRLEASEWQTHNQSVYKVPTDRSSDLRVYQTSNDEMGARSKKVNAELRAATLVGPPDAKLAPQFESEAMNAYVKRPIPEGGIHADGKRVMQTQDYVPIPLSSRDATFQAEVGMGTKADIDAKRLPPVDHATVSEHYTSDVPITLYTEKASRAKLPGTGVFQASKVTSSNPFARSTNFSKPMSDFTKVVDDE
mmetsp:Transcript_11017/g.38253  ORF Transcript_11017/g.38253 Transcript_11017/m.38253 type:complete len:268 (+) Transcript_11017:145-948(+)